MNDHKCNSTIDDGRRQLQAHVRPQPTQLFELLSEFIDIRKLVEQPCCVVHRDRLQLTCKSGLHGSIVIEDEGEKPLVREVDPGRIERTACLPFQSTARLREKNIRCVVFWGRDREPVITSEALGFLLRLPVIARQILRGLPHVGIGRSGHREIRERGGIDDPLRV